MARNTGQGCPVPLEAGVKLPLSALEVMGEQLAIPPGVILVGLPAS